MNGPAAGVTRWPDALFTPTAAFELIEMETDDGQTSVLPYARWQDAADLIDLALLARCRGPVLDIGCGPGRHVAALVGWGHEALGIDTSPTAVTETRRRGAPAALASVFGDVPAQGQWGTALLLDGNIGIGGDVVGLLTRVTELLVPAGRVLVEMEGTLGFKGTKQVRIRHGHQRGEWFSWAWVGPFELKPLARASGLVMEQLWHQHGRWFAQLRRDEETATRQRSTADMSRTVRTVPRSVPVTLDVPLRAR